MNDVNFQDIDGRLDALQKQRNAAMDHVVVLAGRIAVLEAELKAARAPRPPYPEPE